MSLASRMKYLSACLLFGLPVGSVGMFGCTVERGESEIEPQQVPDAISSDISVDEDVGLGGGQGAGTMSGTWVLIHERSTCVEVGQAAEQLTRAVYRVDIEQSGQRLHEQRELCDTSLTPVLGQSIEIPDAVLRTIAFVETDFGFISSLRDGGTYTSATEVALWGVGPEGIEDPVVDPLSEEAEEGSAEIDADGDGQPGVSFVMEGDCKRYTAQRQIIRYRGRFTTPNQIDGESTGHTDIVVYGSSKPICGIAPTVRSNDADSRFRMYRIDGRGGAFDADENGDEDISCQEVRALPIDQVFESRLADDQNCEDS